MKRFRVHPSRAAWWEIRDGARGDAPLIELRDRAVTESVCGLLNNLQREWEQKALAPAGGGQ